MEPIFLNYMADEPQVPAQPEGAGQPTKKKSTPVNLAMVEAAERGIDLTTPAKPAKPQPAPSVEPDSTPVVPAPEPKHTPLEPNAPVPAAPAEPEPAEDAPEATEEGPETPAESSSTTPEPAPDDSKDPVGALATLAESGSQKRLSPRDEDRATALLRHCLSNREGAAALAAMPKLPWILGVRAIEQAWPQLEAEGKTQLLEQLSAMEGEHAVRLRLSVARSLAKIDPPVGVALAGAVAKVMWNDEKGALSNDHSKLVGNVFIGRGKPWILQLSLEGLEAADADAIVSAVVYSAFNVNNPPITQLSILRYAGPRLAGLHANLLAMVAKGVSRWSGKWQDSLRKEVADLPEAISSALKPARPAKNEGKEERAPSSTDAKAEGAEEEAEIPLPPALEEKLKLAVESGDAEAVAAATLEVNAWRDAQAATQAAAQPAEPAAEESTETERKGDKRRRGRNERDRDRDRERSERPERPERPTERKERPAYVSREQEAAQKGGGFNLGATLKQIESHVAQLRNELSNTQSKLRKAESNVVRKSSDKVLLSVEEANLSTDELKRLILQLERRNSELQFRVEELLADSETRALATSADADITVQYRTLLKLKLQEDYSDYLALEKNLPEYVVQQHYRSLIRHVFGVLRDEGVTLEGDLPPPPPEPLPPPPPPPVIEDEEDEEDSALDQLDAEPDSEQAEHDAPEESSEEEAEESDDESTDADAEADADTDSEEADETEEEDDAAEEDAGEESEPAETEATPTEEAAVPAESEKASESEEKKPEA